MAAEDGLLDASSYLSDRSTASEIDGVLARLAEAALGPIGERRVLEAIKRRTRYGVAELRAQMMPHKRALVPVAGPSWIRQIVCSPSGEPCPISSNVLIALRHDADWRGVLGFDEFRQVPMLLGKPPWANGHWKGPVEFNDVDENRALAWIQQQGIHCGIEAVRQALSIVIDDHRYHPIRDYLTAVQWDGIGRLFKLLVYYFGADPIGNYTDIVGAKWMISAVARIFQPGCTAKYALILEGPQDLRKSMALEILGGEFYTDDVAQLGTKDSAMQVGNAWIIELAELDSTRRADINTIKAFVSRKVDRFRKPFGRHVLQYPRQCVLAGTVNPLDEYLNDPTGSVRFWPVECTAIDTDALVADRDQLWAEAVYRYRQGERWWIEDTESIVAARGEQEARYTADSWESNIIDWLNERPSLDEVTTSQILSSALNIAIGDHDRGKQTRVGVILHRLGWSRPKRQWRDGKARPRFYLRPL